MKDRLSNEQIKKTQNFWSLKAYHKRKLALTPEQQA